MAAAEGDGNNISSIKTLLSMVASANVLFLLRQSKSFHYSVALRIIWSRQSKSLVPIFLPLFCLRQSKLLQSINLTRGNFKCTASPIASVHYWHSRVFRLVTDAGLIPTKAGITFESQSARNLHASPLRFATWVIFTIVYYSAQYCKKKWCYNRKFLLSKFPL